MNILSAAIIYVAFFALIGFALYVTNNLWCLAALAFIPEITTEGAK